MHAWSTSKLLLLHSAFMLSVVKMLLKEEVGGRALNSHGNYIVDHGKSWKNHGIVFLNCCGNPAIKHLVNLYIFDEICFTGDYHPTLDNNLKQFTKSVQQYISFVTQASPLRYQDPQITYTAGYTYYIGTMVEQAPYLCESFSF